MEMPEYRQNTFLLVPAVWFIFFSEFANHKLNIIDIYVVKHHSFLRQKTAWSAFAFTK